MNRKKMTLKVGLEALVKEGSCDPGIIARLSKKEVHPLAEEPFPWMLRFYFFLGTTAAALLFLAFCLVLLAMESWGMVIGVGLALIGLGVWVTKRLGHSIWNIATLVIITTGELLVLGGLVLMPPNLGVTIGSEIARATLGAIAMGIPLYYYLPETTHRFMAAVIPTFLAGLWYTQWEYFFLLQIYLFAILAFGAAILWQPLKFLGLRPLATAFILVGIIFSIEDQFFHISLEPAFSMIPTAWLPFRLAVAAGLSVLLIALNYGKLTVKVGMGMAGILLLAIFLPPSILVAVTLMVLARSRGEPTWEVVSLLFLITSLAIFYFRLEAPLYIKGAHLIVSGLILLTGSLLLNQKGEA